MSSVQTRISQPKTRKFVTLKSTYYFSQADVDAWILANSSGIKNHGDLLILSDFTTTMTALNQTSVFAASNFTVTDMGKQIVIGNATESELLTLRLIRSSQNSITALNSVVAYVVEENNASNLTTLKFQVTVARV
jgi:hypothetical protein